MQQEVMNEGAVAAAGRTTVYDLFHARAGHRPDAVALRGGGVSRSYGEMDQRVQRLATALRAQGLRRGDRIALLSENRFEYAELQLAAALLGLIVACQNWRLANEELRHCIDLVSPRLVIVSCRFRDAFQATGIKAHEWVLEEDYEHLIAKSEPIINHPEVMPEDGLVILYTSGTTGLPKGALISHRAEIARMAAYRMDFGAGPEDGFVAWAPMFHMGSTDQMLCTLMSGGIVHVIDGFVPKEIVTVIERYPIGWMLLMPGSIEPIIEIMEAEKSTVRGIRTVGAMVDLVPRALAARLSRLARAPYLNSFGSTETGLPPLSGRLMSPEDLSGSLAKWPSSFADIRLVDEDGHDVPLGTPGEMALRGPTVFSGYWNAPETNAKDFRNGRFLMGDMFIRNADGSYDFVDRAKYMIKSGGENIYPAEIERVLLADPRVRDAVVVRKADARWGEVPVAVVACIGDDLDAAGIEVMCRAHLAGYKRPKEVHFVEYDDLPRSTTGKIVRHEVERRLNQDSG